MHISSKINLLNIYKLSAYQYMQSINILDTCGFQLTFKEETASPSYDSFSPKSLVRVGPLSLNIVRELNVFLRHSREKERPTNQDP